MNPLDLPTRKPRTKSQIRHYLEEHYRYDTMNSWNQSTSYAHCIKVRALNLTSVQRDRCYEALAIDGSWEISGMLMILQAFDARWSHSWQISSNGRSDGYLVLIHGGKHTDGRIYTQPGRNCDQGVDFAAWSLDDLRSRLDLVWDFDQTCNDAVTAFVAWACHVKPVKKTIRVPRQIVVAAER